MKKKTERKTILFGILAFVFIVTCMSVYDMRRNYSSDAVATANSYYAGPGTPLSNVPDDNLSVLVWVGAFDKEGKLDTANGHDPADFPQRELNLVFTLPEIPASTETLFKEIDNQVDAWEHIGNSITDIQFIYDTDKPDWKTLADFLHKLKVFQKYGYRLDVIGKAAWYHNNKEAKDAIQDLGKSAGDIAFRLDEPINDGKKVEDVVVGLNDISFPYFLIMDKDTNNDVLKQNFEKTASFFSGFIIDVRTQEKKTP